MVVAPGNALRAHALCARARVTWEINAANATCHKHLSRTEKDRPYQLVRRSIACGAVVAFGTMGATSLKNNKILTKNGDCDAGGTAAAAPARQRALALDQKDAGRASGHPHAAAARSVRGAGRGETAAWPAEDRAHRLPGQQSPGLSPRVASLRPAEIAPAMEALDPARPQGGRRGERRRTQLRSPQREGNRPFAPAIRIVPGCQRTATRTARRSRSCRARWGTAAEAGPRTAELSEPEAEIATLKPARKTVQAEQRSADCGAQSRASPWFQSRHRQRSHKLSHSWRQR